MYTCACACMFNQEDQDGFKAVSQKRYSVYFNWGPAHTLCGSKLNSIQRLDLLNLAYPTICPSVHPSLPPFSQCQHPLSLVLMLSLVGYKSCVTLPPLFSVFSDVLDISFFEAGSPEGWCRPCQAEGQRALQCFEQGCARLWNATSVFLFLITQHVLQRLVIQHGSFAWCQDWGAEQSLLSTQNLHPRCKQLSSSHQPWWVFWVTHESSVPPCSPMSRLSPCLCHHPYPISTLRHSSESSVLSHRSERRNLPLRRVGHCSLFPWHEKAGAWKGFFPHSLTCKHLAKSTALLSDPFQNYKKLRLEQHV